MGVERTADWAARFPELFGHDVEPYANATLDLRLGAPADELVTRLHLVAVDPDGRVVVCRSVEEWRFLPGGRRERDESLDDLATRELLEETGCRLRRPPGEIFAHHHVTSHDAAPHRPYFPHPESAWAYGVAWVEAMGPPVIPADGETVVEVRMLPPDRAAAWLRVHDPVHADLVLLAEALDLLSPASD